jgi:uncharacterized membrane protein
VMTTAMMAAAVTTAPAATVTASMTASMTTTASRNGKVRHGQHRCEDNRGNSQCDL